MRNRLLDLVFGCRCMLCGKTLEYGALCPSCEDELQTKYADSSRRRGVYTVFRYRDALRRAILRMKFRHAVSYADTFGVILADRAQELALPADCVTYVPISALRMHFRGFNQSEIMARAVAKELGVPCVPAMHRRMFSRRQSKLSHEQRQSNAARAFYLRRGCDLTGKHVLLIDDIITTGATIRSCADLLRRAGAVEVTALVLANAGR
ncbi:MAG: ComF family protein [Butyricicoccaceae bacterium]